MNFYDLIIIGGGAAGQMAAISAARSHPDFKIAIIDRTFALGRKILVCGAGRCNITNINLDKSIEDHYYGGSKEFIRSIFDQFSYKDIVEFFNDLGIELYVERKTDVGKLFPITDQAQTVTALLLDELQRLNIDIHLNTNCDEIVPGENWTIKNTKLNEQSQPVGHGGFASKYLIISAGGKTYPALGSNGSGYNLVESLGHSVIQPVPSALPLEAKNPLSQLLQGVKLDIEVTSIINDQEIKTRTDDVMFTQYGLSGPAILNISREISIHFNREAQNNAWVKLNFIPEKSRAEVEQILSSRWEKRHDQHIEKSLYGLLPNKVAGAILSVNQINSTTSAKDVDPASRDRLLDALTNTRVRISGTRSWNEAEFTAGGVNTSEIKQGTLESLKHPNLYFCGEILDVDGDVGGFNLSWGWSSGFVAGKLE